MPAATIASQRANRPDSLPEPLWPLLSLKPFAAFAGGVAGGCPGGCVCGFSHSAQRAGTNERDSTYAASIANATAKAIGRKRNLPKPGMNANGAKTSSVQQLATSS